MKPAVNGPLFEDVTSIEENDRNEKSQHNFTRDTCPSIRAPYPPCCDYSAQKKDETGSAEPLNSTASPRQLSFALVPLRAPAGMSRSR